MVCGNRVARGDGRRPVSERRSADIMVVYLEGEVQAYRDDQAHDGYVHRARGGAQDGSQRHAALLAHDGMDCDRHARNTMRVLQFPVRLFPELFQHMPVLVERLVGIMSDRVREVTTADQQRDKLMALGKLSAGLAHELNNPAAGATRAANDLIDVLTDFRAADLRLCRHDLTPEQHEALRTFENDAIEHTATAPQLNSLDKAISKTHSHVARRARHGRTLETFQQSGRGRHRCGRARTLLDLNKRHRRRAGARQFAACGRKLASEIKAGTARISELVGAIKEYSYMDQASVQKVDIHKGLESTLLILKYKLNKKNIPDARVCEDLPLIKAYGSELNQVWTNLIVNAVEAMRKAVH